MTVNNGHGSMQSFAHGDILNMDDILHLSNDQRLPVLAIFDRRNASVGWSRSRGRLRLNRDEIRCSTKDQKRVLSKQWAVSNGKAVPILFSCGSSCLPSSPIH